MQRDRYGVALHRINTRTLLVSRTRANFGDRAFSKFTAGPWNYLPTDLRQSDLSHSRFRHWDRRLMWKFRFGQWENSAPLLTSLNCALEIILLTYLLASMFVGSRRGHEAVSLHGMFSPGLAILLRPLRSTCLRRNHLREPLGLSTTYSIRTVQCRLLLMLVAWLSVAGWPIVLSPTTSWGLQRAHCSTHASPVWQSRTLSE